MRPANFSKKSNQLARWGIRRRSGAGVHRDLPVRAVAPVDALGTRMFGIFSMAILPGDGAVLGGQRPLVIFLGGPVDNHALLSE